MQHLIDGYRQFKAQRWPQERARYETLALGQSPRVLVIACSDSRVDPATILGAGPGELFVVRNVANLVPGYEPDGGLHGVSAAIEFAVKALKVETILVMGHAQCGGVAAALEPARIAGTEFLPPWVALIEEDARAACAHQADPQTALEQESIRRSLQRLATFPFVAEAMAEGRLALAGARFGIESGQLEVLNPATGAFEAVG